MSLVFGWSVAFGEFFVSVYGVALGIFAMVTGVTLFLAERRQGGIEYLLTLPLSRTRLLWVKILPRFTALAVFSILYIPVLYLVSGGKGADSVPALPPFLLFYTVFMLFFLAVSLSASHDNFVLLIIGTLFIFIVHTLLITRVFQSALRNGFDKYFQLESTHAAVLGIVSLVLPFMAAFVLSFKKFDVHPGKRFNRKFLKVFIPVIIAGLLVSFIYAYGVGETDYKMYYLTKDYKLIESDWDSARVYDKDGGETVSLDTPFMRYNPELIESDGYIYTMSHLGRNNSIIRMKQETGEVETIYEFKRYTSFYARGQWFSGRTLAFFEGDRNHEDIDLMLLNVDTMGLMTIKLGGKIPVKKNRLWLFGMDETDGKRFWLLASERSREYPLFRVWEDGNIEKLGTTMNKPAYANGMLITVGKEGMVFAKLTAEGPEEIKTVIPGKGVYFHRLWSSRPDLNNIPRKELYGIRFGKERNTLMRVDLENLEVTKVLEAEGRFHWFSPEECYLFSTFGKPGKFYRVLPDGQLKLLHDFTGYDGMKWGHRFNIYRSGIIVKEGEKISVYAFPDLNELTFKDLE